MPLDAPRMTDFDDILLHQSCSLFCDEIELLIESIFDSSDILIIVGDFNLWIDVEGDADAEKVVSLMNAYGLSQLVDKQTHRETFKNS